MMKLLKAIRKRVKNLFLRLKVYFRKLLFPIYLFPLKLVTYTTYYLIKFLIKLILALLGIIWDTISFPFRSLKNLLKSLFRLGLGVYFLLSVIVIMDYLQREHDFYGVWGNWFCEYGVKDRLEKSVVRVVGGYGEGSGFFITDDQVLTNFHVIDGEPSPKVILANGNFITPVRIIGDKKSDLAILYTLDKYPDLVMPLPEGDKAIKLTNTSMLAAGYPLGTSLTGKATIMKGRFIDFRKSSKNPVAYIQTDINLVVGMSGGPLTDSCGRVIGINTKGVAGLSLFILANYANDLVPKFTDQEIEKINVDPSLSPQEAVNAYYTYLKTRRLEAAYNLLSKEYLRKSTFEEYASRFSDVLDVNVFRYGMVEKSKDTVSIKFGTKNWVEGEAVYHYYEGIWKMVKEAEIYKILSGKISEVDNPDSSWFYQ